MIELHPSKPESIESHRSPSKRRTVWLRQFFHACRILLGGVFVFSAIPKILLTELFAQSLYDTGVASIVPAGVLIYAVPAIELTVGCLLLIGGPLLGAALLWSTVLLVGFTFFQSYLIVWGVEAACGCFDPTSQESAGWMGWLRTLGLLIVSVIASAAWLRSIQRPSS